MALPHVPVAVPLVLLFGIGTLSTLSGGAATDLVRSTVSFDAYVPARSLLRLAAQIAQIGGNAAGGLLIVVLAPGGLLLFNAASFLFSSVIVRLVVRDHANTGQARRRTLLRDSLHGARQICTHRPLLRLLLLGWLEPMLSVVPEAVAAPYVAGHGKSSAWVGWWLVAAPLGTIIGDILGVRLLSPRQQRRLVAPAAAASFILLLGFAFNPPVPAAMALVLASSTGVIYALGLDDRVRLTAPCHLFARTMTLNAAGLATFEGIGFTIGGAAAQAIGPAAAVFAAGVCGITMTILLVGQEIWPSGKSTSRPSERKAVAQVRSVTSGGPSPDAGVPADSQDKAGDRRDD
jgi:hypothetical protein